VPAREVNPPDVFDSSSESIKIGSGRDADSEPAAELDPPIFSGAIEFERGDGLISLDPSAELGAYLGAAPAGPSFGRGWGSSTAAVDVAFESPPAGGVLSGGGEPMP
jgi:hypothetical protein